MFCEKCGAALDDDAVFCPDCGASLKETDGKRIKKESEAETGSEKKRNSGLIIALSIAGGVAMLCLFVGIHIYNNMKYINLVKNGSPKLYPDSTYGEAFENFFDDPEWEYFKSTEEKDIVEFSGGCTYMDEPVTATLQFDLDYEKGRFSTEYFEMDGEEQSELMTMAILAKVFSEYENEDGDAGVLNDLEEDTDDWSNGNYDAWGNDFSDNSGNDSSYNLQDDDSWSDDTYYGSEDDAWSSDSDYDTHYDSDDADDYDSDDYDSDDYDADDYDTGYDSGDYDSDDSDTYDEAEEEYIFPESDSRLLKKSELKNCSAEELRLGRNEIYARYGRKFQDAELQEYFDSMSWYTGFIEPEDFDESVLNKYEKKNLKIIKKYEND